MQNKLHQASAFQSKTRFVFTAAFVLVLLGLLWFSHQLLSKPNAEAGNSHVEKAVPVTVDTVEQASVPIEIKAIGNTEALSNVAIKSQVDGQILQVHFKEGQYVHTGDLLFTIDPTPFQVALQQSQATVNKDKAQLQQLESTMLRDQAQVKQAQANLLKDKAQLNLAKAQEKRYADLLKKEFVSHEQYDEINASLQASLATISEDQAAIENVEALVQSDESAIRSQEATIRGDEDLVTANHIKLSYCYIHSPLTGAAGPYQVHPGDMVKSNDTSLVSINQIAPINVSFAVPEQDLDRIKAFQSMGKLKVIAQPNTPSASPESGQLTFINNAIDPGTGTIQLKGTFENKTHHLWPGQFVNVMIHLANEDNAIVIPSQAIETGQKGDYVFVDNAGVGELRPIVVDRIFSDKAVIKSGLKPGEQVVTDGQLLVSPGIKLTLKK